MIDPKDYPFHIEALGSEEEFNEYIKNFIEAAPTMSEEKIKEILNGEEEAEIGPSMWCNPWQY